MPRIELHEGRTGHIFREADGHFSEDTAVNRQMLIETASRSENLLGGDRFGNEWFAEVRTDGTQIWAQVRDGKITNGGVNITPRDFDFTELPTLPVTGATR